MSNRLTKQDLDALKAALEAERNRCGVVVAVDAPEAATLRSLHDRGYFTDRVRQTHTVHYRLSNLGRAAARLEHEKPSPSITGRRTGKTSQQIKDAPEGAIFVWCTIEPSYPKRLAAFLNRTDLLVVPSTYFKSARDYQGRRHVVVDHAADLDAQSRHWLNEYRRQLA